MGYFDAIAASSFMTDSAGRHVFFPWGALGMGYVVPTDTEYQRLRATLVWSYRVLIPVPLLLIVLFPRWMPWPSLGLVLLFVFGYPLWVRRVTSAWSPSAERLSIRQSVANGAQRQSRGLLLFLLIGSLGFVAGGCLELVKLPHWYVGALTILFFGSCAVLVSWMLALRRRAQKPRYTRPG